MAPHGWGLWMEASGSVSEAGFYWYGVHYHWTALLLYLSLLLCVLIAILLSGFAWDAKSDCIQHGRDRLRLWWRGSSLPLSEWLYLRYGRNGREVDTAHRFLVYRCLEMRELAELPRHGLRASDPNAERTPEEHVRDGSKPGYRDQWISATADLIVARKWAGVFGNLVILRASPQVLDLSTRTAQYQHLRLQDEAGFLRQSNHAHRSVEVLFERSVLPRDVARCSMERCEMIMHWPPDEELARICEAAEGQARTHTQRLRQYIDDRRAALPVLREDSVLDVADWKVHGSVGRFVHVEQPANGGVHARHYLAFCGAPNLHWTSTLGQPLASERELVVQCQTEVMTHILYRLLLPEEHAAFPLCVLILCRLTHGVPFTHQRGRHNCTRLPAAQSLTPLLLYDYDPRLSPLPAPDRMAAIPVVPTPATRALFRRTWVFDALLMNFSPSAHLFKSGADLRRYGQQNCLASRVDALRDFLPELDLSHAPDLARTLLTYLKEAFPYGACASLNVAATLLESARDETRAGRPVWKPLLTLLQCTRLMGSEAEWAELATASRPVSIPPLDLNSVPNIEQHFETRVAQLHQIVAYHTAHPDVVDTRELLMRAGGRGDLPPPYEDC